MVVQGPANRREIAADDFFRFHLTTSRAPNEIVVEAQFPVLSAGHGWAFDEITRRHGDYAIAGLGAIVGLGPDGRASTVRLAACGIAPRPIRLLEAEALLIGSPLRETDLKAAGAAATNCVTAPDDMHASKSYRRRLIATLVRRLVATAAMRSRASVTIN